MKTSVSVIRYLCLVLAELAGGAAARSPALGKTGIAGTARQLAADAELLADAWSDMALRNVLADLLRGVRRIQHAPQQASIAKAFDKAKAGGGKRAPREGLAPDDLPDGMDDICGDLVKRIDALLLQHSPSKARYGEVACFGFRVKVAGDTYTGSTDDAADLRARCDELKQAIRAAYALADQGGRQFNARTGMLKVFMAPEFFFRGANGAYSHAVIGGYEGHTDDKGRKVPAAAGLVKTMLEEIGQAQYKDWLFVLGTAIAASEETKHLCKAPGCGGKVVFDNGKPVCREDRSHRVEAKRLGAVVDNIGFIVKEGEVHTVSKELVSHIDFVKDKAKNQRDLVTVTVDRQAQELPVRRHPKPSGYTAASGKASRFSDERMGGCIFTIDGVTIGVEVCLDHDATTDSASKGRLAHAGNIQLQLIPSAGMVIKSFGTVQGGVVFNVDGLTPHVQAAGGGLTPELNLNYGDDFFRFSKASWNDLRAVGADLNKLQQLKDLGKGAWDAPVNVQGPAGKGAVVMFGPYDLPAV